MYNSKDFPSSTIKQRAIGIYPKRGIVNVDGFKNFDLKELGKIPLAIRLDFPAELFTAIDKAQIA